MGGEGYALCRAISDTALAQLRSRENRARSDFPRRSPSDMYEVWRNGVEDCMEKTAVFKLFSCGSRTLYKNEIPGLADVQFSLKDIYIISAEIRGDLISACSADSSSEFQNGG